MILFFIDNKVLDIVITDYFLGNKIREYIKPMKTSDYQYLLGKEKKEVIEKFGSEFNYYHSEIWSYHVKTNWWGRKYYLLILFKNEIVQKVQIKKSYAKLGY